MTGYCAACGKRAPTSGARDAPDVEPEFLGDRRWLCIAARPLRGQDRDVGWNLLCPTCLHGGRPFALELVRAWGVTPEALERVRRTPPRKP